MNDSTVSGEPDRPDRWLLLIHQLPPKPDYLRVKVRRRLRGIGALAIKNTVYVLPQGSESLEDFQWLAREIESEGGEAIICAASFIAGLSDAKLRDAFNADARARDGVTDAPNAMQSIDRAPRGRTWVTRAGVFVDRIASAWLIQRFVDPEARFAFTSETRYQPRPGELRFDMFGGEYTHEGDRCTFETLCSRFGLEDPALAVLAEIVHDIDLKDDKYGRAETPGVLSMLKGIAVTTQDDDERLERGAGLFDGLYATLRLTTSGE